VATIRRLRSTPRLPAEERRKLILLAAINVFAHSGYRGATTRAIAREAGVAEALLYRYFTNKQELFGQAVEHTSSRIVASVQGIFERNTDNPILAFTELLQFSRTMLLKNASMARMLFIVSAELDDPEVRNIYLPWQNRALETIENAIRRWQLSGALRPTIPPRATAWLVLGSFQALALMKHSGSLKDVEASEAFALVQSILQPDAA
jgi:AcrR family transcriptional regulator